LLRHGETSWNREKIFRGQADVPLNDYGRRQAKALATALNEKYLQHPVFITSPLQRSRETAEIAAGCFPEAKVHTSRYFLDISYGKWEGQPQEKIKKLYPELYGKWIEQPEKVVFPEGECLEKVADRAEKGIYQFILDNPKGDTIIIAHQAINKALLCRLLGAGMQSFWKLGQDTACLNQLQYLNGFFVLVQLNDTCHLDYLN